MYNMLLKSYLLEEKDLFIVHSQYVAADGLVMQGGRVSSAMISIYLFQNIPVPALEVLTQ